MFDKDGYPEQPMLSRPTRGAWIEIRGDLDIKIDGVVAPHTGRVD